MGNIVNDIVDSVEIKPNKNKLILKWVISIAISLIAMAFVLGQFKSSFFNRMDKFEETLNKNTASIEIMKTDMSEYFVEVNTRIDKGYTDGFEALQDYQEFNKRQLILVLDYGQSNKEMLKEMLEINMQERQKTVENQMIEARNEPVNYESNISIRPFKEIDYLNMTHFIEEVTSDTIFNVTGATKKFVDKIDRNKYVLGAILNNERYSDLYDVSYRKKQ